MKKFKVKLVKSLIGCSQSQIKTANVLGLKKINNSRTFIDTPQFRGQVKKIQHLIILEKESK
ncbi:MAG: 50S ribosomal protein L30 [Deltaproteobacteria bacterium]|jgi:large subunit ribosomal protein L30|nr:50S ribosomal protein L30 [Deltaproteobacteria bacterium]